jgi:hypothetical protein
MNIFHKIKSLFELDPHRQILISVPCKVQFQIRTGIFSPSDLTALYSHIQLWKMLEYQTEVTELQEQIPDEYIGLRIIRDEKPQESRAYFKIESGLIEKETLSWILTDPLIPEEGGIDPNNTYYP